jgi:ribosomal protein L12E/L44/L45/RPP1/RPP2
MRYSGTTLHVHLEGQKHSQESIRQILNTDGIEVEELRVVPAGLEDAFLYLTRPTKNEMSTEAS